MGMKFKFLAVIFALLSLPAYAGAFSHFSDTIIDSAPSAVSDHTIQFTLDYAVPASGKIIITPQDGKFSIPSGLDYTDIDLAVYSGGSFVDRPLAPAPSAADDGVSVVSGVSGSITFTLNSTSGIGAGEIVRIKIGDNAVYGETGDQYIQNPATPGSYKIFAEARDEFDSVIIIKNTMIAVVLPVTVGPIIALPPIRYNGLPSGEIAAGNSTIEISLSTNKYANCRYATTSDVEYSLMTGYFTTTGGTIHAVVLTGFQDGTAYSFYVRCADAHGYVHTDDYVISFSLKPTPTQPAGGEGGGGGGGGGRGGGSPYVQSGNIIGGSQDLYLASVVFTGWSYPQSIVVFLQDGSEVGRVVSGDNGSFSDTINMLERGTYTFIVYSVDSKERKSASYSSTITLGQGTNNSIAGIVIPPTVELDTNTINAGDKVIASGEAVPGSSVELYVKPQTNSLSVGSAQEYTATSTGTWQIAIDTSSFKNGTYEVKARSVLAGQAESSFSGIAFLGVGGEPAPDFSLRADINKDGKVNIVDFSILLAYWGTSDADADIDSNGTVNLNDFSIMLFYWTG